MIQEDFTLERIIDARLATILRRPKLGCKNECLVCCSLQPSTQRWSPDLP